MGGPENLAGRKTGAESDGGRGGSPATNREGSCASAFDEKVQTRLHQIGRKGRRSTL